MFQILCALVLDVPDAAECLTNFNGVSHDVLLDFEPWGHVDHMGVECGCRSSDRTGTYVHAVAFDHPTSTPVLSHQARQIMGMFYRAGIQPVSPVYPVYPVYLCHRVMGSLRCGPVRFRLCLTEPVHMAGCSWQLMNT